MSSGIPFCQMSTLCNFRAFTLPLIWSVLSTSIHITDAPEKVRAILLKHLGKGRVGAIGAARELMAAGYDDNARMG